MLVYRVRLIISCDVPKGSCFAPLLFLLYISDLPCPLKCCTVTLYADDTSLAHPTKDIKDMASALNTELQNVKVWLHDSKLSLTVANTTSMLIGTRHNL